VAQQAASAKAPSTKAPAAKSIPKPAPKAPIKQQPSVTRPQSSKAAAAKPAQARPAAHATVSSAAATSKATATTAMPVPSVAASRFADRFAPARPPQRTFVPAIDASRSNQVKADPKLANAWKAKPGRELTEDEVLAMPDSEYMNEKQLDFFRSRLQALKDDLLSNAGETTEHLREDTSIVPDPADRATIEEEHALELRTRDRERKLLKKISQSLARIESGDYGFCDETGEPIGLGRLLARPTATLSLEAQQRREMKQKMFGD
jgi:DnaK suppressor protein